MTCDVMRCDVLHSMYFIYVRQNDSKVSDCTRAKLSISSLKLCQLWLRKKSWFLHDATMLQQMKKYNTCKFYHFLCILTQLMCMFIPWEHWDGEFFSLFYPHLILFFLSHHCAPAPFMSLHLFVSLFHHMPFSHNMLFTFSLRYIKTTLLQTTTTVCAIIFFLSSIHFSCFSFASRLVKVSELASV